MNYLDKIITKNDLLIVKETFNNLIFKMRQQKSPNKKLINEFLDNCKKIDNAYLWINRVNEDNVMVNNRNRQLEQILIEKTIEIREQKKELIELEKQLNEIKLQINF